MLLSGEHYTTIHLRKETAFLLLTCRGACNELNLCMKYLDFFLDFHVVYGGILVGVPSVYEISIVFQAPRILGHSKLNGYFLSWHD